MTDIVQSAENVGSSVVSVVSTITGFLTKHVVDLNNVASVLGELVNISPIDAQDKTRITDVIGQVQSSADNITNWLQSNQVAVTANDVVVKESDLVNAVADYFNSDAGKAALAAAAHPTQAATNG